MKLVLKHRRMRKIAGMLLIAAAIAGCESGAARGGQAAGEPLATGAGPGPGSPAEQLDAAVRGQVAEALAQVLAEYYVYEEIGREMAEAIRNRLQEGAYDGIRSPVEFADALQADLREISRDGHLGVRYEPMSPAPGGAEPGGPAPSGPAPRAAKPADLRRAVPRRERRFRGRTASARCGTDGAGPDRARAGWSRQADRSGAEGSARPGAPNGRAGVPGASWATSATWR